MGHHTCCNKQKVRRGLWSPEEDEKLIKYISTFGHGCWSSVPRLAGLQRCGKSCRLRWINYLRPDLKRGSFSPQEESLIIELHRILGNRWAQISKHLPGRTDNEVKNFWNSSIKKKLISRAVVNGLSTLSDHTTNPVPSPSSNDDFLPTNTYPNQIFTAQEHFYLPTATSIAPGYVQEGDNINTVKQFIYNVERTSVEQPPSEASSYDSQWPSAYRHHLNRQQNQVNCHNLQIESCANAKFMIPFDQFVEECIVPSSSALDLADPSARLPCLPFRPYTYDLRQPTDQTDYMEAALGSTSSSSSSAPISFGNFPMNPSLISHWGS